MATSASKMNSPSAQMTRHLILLTGVPGVGKTTLMGKLHKALSQQGVACSGFITEEVRVGGCRVGFDVVTVDGQRGTLARVSEQTERLPGSRQREYKVGQYSVNLLSFEQTALPTLRLPKNATQESSRNVFLIDEIGKMELFSERFIQTVRHLLSQTNINLVATIPVPKGRGRPLHFVEEIRSKPEAQVFEVTRANRDCLLDDLLKAVNS